MGMMNGMMGDDQQDMDIFQIDASSALKSTSNLPKTLVKHNNPQQSLVSLKPNSCPLTPPLRAMTLNCTLWICKGCAIIEVFYISLSIIIKTTFIDELIIFTINPRYLQLIDSIEN
jgi:hypothetical protein